MHALHRSRIWEKFVFESGVQQGFILALILFLQVVGNIVHAAVLGGMFL